MKKICLISIIIINTMGLIAQRDLKPGYIITNNGDTVFGQIDYQGDSYNAGCCYFLRQNTSESVKYLPGEIKAYQIVDGKYYVSRKVKINEKEMEVFLEFLVNGKLDLYYYPDDYYFIEKDDKELHILENTEKIVYAKMTVNQINDMMYIRQNKEYIGVLGAYMNDCPAITKEIYTSRLEQKDLIKIVTDYHNLVCPGEQCTVYSKQPPHFTLKIGLNAGYSYFFNELTDLNTEQSVYDNATGYTTGIQLDMGSKGTYERFYSSIIFDYAEYKTNFKVISNSDFEFNARIILLGAGLNYKYPRYKLKPTVGIGIMLLKSLNSSKAEINNVPINMAVKSLGIYYTAGIFYDITPKVSIKFDIYYKSAMFNYASGIEDYAMGTSNLNFGLGIFYNLKGN
jgi:hypothetical protein